MGTPPKLGSHLSSTHELEGAVRSESSVRGLVSGADAAVVRFLVSPPPPFQEIRGRLGAGLRVITPHVEILARSIDAVGLALIARLGPVPAYEVDLPEDVIEALAIRRTDLFECTYTEWLLCDGDRVRARFDADGAPAETSPFRAHAVVTPSLLHLTQLTSTLRPR